MEEKPRKQVYCYRCGKWLSRWHYVYENGRMVPVCWDEILCERSKRKKGKGRRAQ